MPNQLFAHYRRLRGGTRGDLDSGVAFLGSFSLRAGRADHEYRWYLESRFPVDGSKH
jgi:hypothetical protein